MDRSLYVRDVLLKRFSDINQKIKYDAAASRGYNLQSFRWCLVSLGPDNEQQLDGGRNPGFYPYDASNGLSSYGDILRLGP